MPRPARIGAARRLVGRGFVMRIAEPAIAAAQQHDPLVRAGQVGEHGFLVVVEDLGPDGHAQHEIAAVGAGTVGPGSATPVLGAKMLLIAVIDQRVEVVGRDKDDVAALATYAAIGAAEPDELLAPEAEAAAAAATALEVDVALIEEFHGRNKLKRAGRGPPPSRSVGWGNGYSAASAGRGTIEMKVRPPRPLRNRTAPSSSPNSVCARRLPPHSPG